MTPIRTLIVDDDIVARKVMHHMLEQYSSISVIGEAANPQDAIRLANAQRPDLLILDVEMPSMNGFSILSSLDYSPQVIFVTGHTSYAVQAFDVNATDYLVKPVSSERLALTIARVNGTATPRPAIAESDIIYLRDGGQIFSIHRSKITAITADSNFTRIHQTDAQPLFIRKAISEWEELLPCSCFARLNRSLIVNLHYIRNKKTINRDKALLYIEGIEEPFTLRRVALQRFHKIEEKLILQTIANKPLTLQSGGGGGLLASYLSKFNASFGLPDGLERLRCCNGSAINVTPAIFTTQSS